MTGKRLREQAGWRPVWDGVVKGWATNFIRKNKWRCEGIHDFEDLLQDAYLVFLRVMGAYPRVVDPKHFMALYKVSLLNEITNMSRTKRRQDELISPVNMDDVAPYQVGELGNAGYVNALLNELPDEMKMALAILGEPEKLRSDTGSPYMERENLNAKLKRLAGIDPENDADFITQLKCLLRDA